MTDSELPALDADSPCWVETHPKKGISYYRSKGKVNGEQIFYNAKDIDPQVAGAVNRITITDEAASVLEKELATWFDFEGNGDDELKRAESRLIKLRKVEKNLRRLVIEEGISFRDFREHRSEIEAERATLNETIETIRAKRNLAKADFEIAINLAKQIDFLFEKGTFNERRLLCETLFKRVYINGGKIIKKPNSTLRFR